MPRSLTRYREMRDFGATPEPSGRAGRAGARRRTTAKPGIYVVQKHMARRLHYDFRLEFDGVLLSWAIPREPSMSIGVRRLAVRTEDHPLEYAQFRGDIPEGHYGAGHVDIWDRGTWKPVGDPRAGLEAGRLKFDLDGDRLSGRFVLVRMRSGHDERRENWLADPRTRSRRGRGGQAGTAQDVDAARGCGTARARGATRPGSAARHAPNDEWRRA